MYLAFEEFANAPAQGQRARSIECRCKGDQKLEATPVATIDCPYCSEPIHPKSKKCKHCGEVLDPQMREIEMLKRHSGSPHVFMNAGGASASSSSAASASSSGSNDTLRRFPHWFHIIMTLISGFLWLPIYILMYIFRNKRYYY